MHVTVYSHPTEKEKPSIQQMTERYLLRWGDALISDVAIFLTDAQLRQLADTLERYLETANV